MTATLRPPLSPLRRDRITASRLPALLGLSPYTTRNALMRSMVREHFGDEEEFTGNIATDWGHLHEAEAIAEYELTVGNEVWYSGRRQHTLVHPVFDYFAATPDGLTADRIVEVKAPFRSLYSSITERPDYHAQVQLQMEVTGRDLADLVIWRPGQPVVISTVERDMTWLADQIPAVEKFLDEYQAVLDDPLLHTPHREPLRDVRTDDEWAVAAAEWLEVDYLIKQLEAAKNAAAARLRALSPDKNARGNGIDLLRYERAGSVSYKKVVDELNAAEALLEKYRGKPAEVTVIKRLGANQ